MEIRKVQMSGGSSYIVSLPKKWVADSHIKKNDPVGLIVQEDGTLLITPNIKGIPEQKEKVFEVTAGTDPTFLLRCLIGAYIAGYTTIRIRAKGRLPPFVLGLVREFTNSAVGQEVVEETETSIVLKDLLNPAEMPFDNTIRRMTVIVKGMHKDAISALRSGDAALAQDVINRDTDVDRLHWLIARQNGLIVSDIGFGRKMGVSIDLAEKYFLVGRIIERIADHGARIAYNVLELVRVDGDFELIGKIEAASDLAQDIFQNSIDSFLDADMRRAHETITRSLSLDGRCRQISTGALNYDAETAIRLVHISDSIRRIGDYSADICESAINYLIREY